MPRVDTSGTVQAADSKTATKMGELTERRAGDHANVQVLPDGQLQLTLDVPFELPSMAEAELDISGALVVLRGPVSLGKPEVSAPLPTGFELDPDQAVAKYSKKRRQLTISSPNRGTLEEASQPQVPTETSGDVTAPAAATAAGAATASSSSRGPEPEAGPAEMERAAVRDSGPAAPVPHMNGTSHSPGQEAELAKGAEASSSSTSTAATTPTTPTTPEPPAAPTVVDWQTEPEVNDIAQQMMMKALAAKEKKKKQTEDDRKASNMSSGGGLKKGFLSGGAKLSKSKPANGKEKKEEDIPFISFSGSNAEDAKRNSLKIDEVQQQLQQGKEMLKNDQSWVTPQLMAALQARPDIQKAMQDPKILEAINLFQTDPTLAQQKYKNDPEVSKFMKEFMSLMATHFNVLGSQADTTKKPQGDAAATKQAPASAPAQTQAQAQAPAATSASREIVLPTKSLEEPLLEEVGFSPPPRGNKTAPLNLTRPAQPQKLSSEELTRNLDPDDPLAKALSDPKVADAWQDPEVQKVIQEVRAGRQLEMREFARDNPRVFMKMKYLLDAGLMGMAA